MSCKRLPVNATICFCLLTMMRYRIRPARRRKPRELVEIDEQYGASSLDRGARLTEADGEGEWKRKDGTDTKSEVISLITSNLGFLWLPAHFPMVRSRAAR